MAAVAQRFIDAVPLPARLQRDAIEHVGKVESLLREQGCPEAAELARFCERWRAEQARESATEKPR